MASFTHVFMATCPMLCHVSLHMQQHPPLRCLMPNTRYQEYSTCHIHTSNKPVILRHLLCHLQGHWYYKNYYDLYVQHLERSVLWFIHPMHLVDQECTPLERLPPSHISCTNALAAVHCYMCFLKKMLLTAMEDATPDQPLLG